MSEIGNVLQKRKSSMENYLKFEICKVSKIEGSPAKSNAMVHRSAKYAGCLKQ